MEMLKIDRPTFGPGGNSDAFYADGKKATFQAPEWIRSIGLMPMSLRQAEGSMRPRKL